MATRTTTQLAAAVMRLPNWISSEEDPDAEDAAYIKSVYSDFYAEWVVKERAYWPEGAIPQEAFQHIARIIADSVAPHFGQQAPVEFDIENGEQVSMGTKGWRGLKRLTEVKSSRKEVRSTYF